MQVSSLGNGDGLRQALFSGRARMNWSGKVVDEQSMEGFIRYDQCTEGPCQVRGKLTRGSNPKGSNIRNHSWLTWPPPSCTTTITCVANDYDSTTMKCLTEIHFSWLLAFEGPSNIEVISLFSGSLPFPPVWFGYEEQRDSFSLPRTGWDTVFLPLIPRSIRWFSFLPPFRITHSFWL